MMPRGRVVWLTLLGLLLFSTVCLAVLLPDLTPDSNESRERQQAQRREHWDAQRQREGEDARVQVFKRFNAMISDLYFLSCLAVQRASLRDSQPSQCLTGDSVLQMCELACTQCLRMQQTINARQLTSSSTTNSSAWCSLHHCHSSFLCCSSLLLCSTHIALMYSSQLLWLLPQQRI